MPTYKLTWKGDRVREYSTKGGQPRLSCRIAVEDEEGNRHTKLELTRPKEQGLPNVGDTLTGEIEAHPRFDDLSRLVEGNAPIGGGAAPATGSGGSGTPPVAQTSRDEAIQRQTALKVAGVIVASYVGQGAVTIDEAPEMLRKLTNAGAEVIEGRGQEEGKADGGSDPDGDDIPF